MTMERLAATARADMFVETFGRQVVVQPRERPDDAASCRGRRAFFNRELSWLAFNERVLEEAARSARRRCSNDQVRLHCRRQPRRVLHGAGRRAQQAIADDDAPVDLAGLTPAAAADSWSRERSHEFVAALYELTTRELLPALARTRHPIRRRLDLEDVGNRAALAAFFRDTVSPVLTPLAIDEARPFPLLASLSLNLARPARPAADEEPRLAIVQVPAGLTRLVQIPDRRVTSSCSRRSFAPICPSFFPDSRFSRRASSVSARDAELELDEEGGRTHLELVEREVRRRRRSDVVRLEVEATASAELVGLLRDRSI